MVSKSKFNQNQKHNTLSFTITIQISKNVVQFKKCKFVFYYSQHFYCHRKYFHRQDKFLSSIFNISDMYIACHLADQEVQV